MQVLVLTNTYTRITPAGSGIGIIQGNNAEAFLGTTAPTDTSAGIKLVDNWPIPVDADKFTHIWVRGNGVARFAG